MSSEKIDSVITKSRFKQTFAKDILKTIPLKFLLIQFTGKAWLILSPEYSTFLKKHLKE